MLKENRHSFLLDCTLRDGGYINDWKFGRDNIASIFERQVSSGVDFIEVGFIDERRPFDPDRTIQPDTASFTKIFGNLEHKSSMSVAMIDYGTCSIDQIQPQREQWLDGIRVIFKKKFMREAVEFCSQLCGLGYKVFTQAVSITSYNDEELEQLVDLVNACHPFAMSMVDTYGLLDAEAINHIVSVIDRKLLPDICLGYHAHNNFQLGYANAVSFLNNKLERNVLVDGSLYGMGKSAGNAPLELIAMYMNRRLGKSYDITQMQEAIANNIQDIFKKTPWGYTLFFYIAAFNDCHPDYVAYLLNKRTLSVTEVNELLSRIPKDEKLNKNMKLIEELYLEYQETQCEDSNAVADLAELLQGKNVLILGPGSTIRECEADIQTYISRNSPVVISINYIPSAFRPDHIFLTNSRRYLQMASKLADAKYKELSIIATSNVTRTGGKFPYVVNYSKLIDKSAEFPDNSMIMLLKLLRRIGASKVALAGFDGYTPDNVNFFDTNMEYSFIKEKAESLNRYASAFLNEYIKSIKLSFITPTQYDVR